MKYSIKFIAPLLLISAGAIAQPFNSFESRSMAMGDTGVAVSKGAAAMMFNPAQLSENTDDRLSFIWSAGVSVFADQDAMDALENIGDDAYIDGMDSGLTFMNNATTEQDFIDGKTQFTTNARSLNDNLSQLSEKPFRISAGGFIGGAMSTETLGVGAYYRADVTIETTPIIDSCDTQTLDGYTTFLEQINSETDLVNSYTTGSPNHTIVCTNNAGDTRTVEMLEVSGSNVNLYDPTDDLESSVLAAGVTVSEFGLSLSRQFEVMGKSVSFGVTPKLQNITSYYAAPTVQNLDDDNYDLADDFENSDKSESAFNIDVGVSTSFLPDDALTVGLTIRNLLGGDFETSAFNADGDTAAFSTDMQARAGLAWDLPAGFSLAADLDLTENDPYFFGDSTQFLGVGAEWDIVNTLRLRAGMRNNLSNDNDQTFSVGFGFNIVAFHMDAALQSGQNNLGGSVQMGLAF